jgi:hypothetical protein
VDPDAPDREDFLAPTGPPFGFEGFVPVFAEAPEETFFAGFFGRLLLFDLLVEALPFCFKTLSPS